MWIGKRECDKWSFGEGKCARCGKYGKLTKDHFIPKCCGMTVNKDGNYVGVCYECNQEKADKIVTPDWYPYISREKREMLDRYMRYAGSYVSTHTDDPQVLEYLEKLREQVKNQSIPLVIENTLTPEELKTWQRIKGEPESLLQEEE